MSLTTCNVLCTVHDDAGTPVQGATVSAKLNQFEVYNGYIVPQLVEGMTNASGQVTLALWPNQLGSTESMYVVKIAAPNGKRLTLNAVVPNQSSIELHLIAELPPYDGKTDGQLILDAAVAAGATAIAKAAEAAASASSATSSATTATAKASEASTSSAAATLGANTATTKAAEASTSASQAATQAATAFNKAGDASASATSAAASASAANVNATEAAASATSAANSASTANTKAATATTKAAEAASSASAAAASAASAASSATSASGSASTATTKASDASASAASAATSATSATGSAALASTKATDAAASASTSTAQAQIATTKASEAATSASNASSSAGVATTKASEATASATTATTKASDASASASTASTAATAASNSATAAQGSATAASGSASLANTKASEAATSATAAAASASSANTSATSATGSATTATTKASEASTSATNADTSAKAAAGSATSAATSAGNAATSASTAQGAASTATTQAGVATTKASEAAASAAAAASSAGAATAGGIRFDTTQSLSGAEKTQARNNMGLATVASSGAYSDLSGLPTSLSSFTNDPGYITSAALAAYLPLAGGTLTGDLAFSGTGLRITGDFTNGTVASRTLFQTSTVNGNSYLTVVPNGTGVNSQFQVYNSSDTANSSIGAFVASASQVRIVSGYIGTGVMNPITFIFSNTEAARFDPTTKNFLIGTSTDNATDKLQVNGTARSTGFRVTAPGQALGADAGMDALIYGQFHNNNGTLYVGRDDSTGGYWSVPDAHVIYGTGSTSPLVFGVNGIMAMRLMPSTRNLLINTATDDGVNKLQVNGKIAATTATAADPHVLSLKRTHAGTGSDVLALLDYGDTTLFNSVAGENITARSGPFLIRAGKGIDGSGTIDAVDGGGIEFYAPAGSYDGTALGGTANDPVTPRWNFVGQLTQDGYQVLHAGNYQSWALSRNGGTVTGDILNSAAYSAPNQTGSFGTKLTIRGSTGAGTAGASGGNGYVEILGGGASTSWTLFGGISGRRRGGILLQAGTAQGDSGNTFVNGSFVDIRGSNGTNNGASTGTGSTINLIAGSTTRIDSYGNNGAFLAINGANGAGGGSVSISGGTYGGSPSNTGASIAVYGGSSAGAGSIYLNLGSGTGANGAVIINNGAIQETRKSLDANDINLSAGNYFTKTISGATTLTVSNVPSNGTAANFILDLTNGGSSTITWWSGVKWAGGAAPTLTSAGRDVLGFFTHDGGTTWTGLMLGKDAK